MKAAPFEYARAGSLREALELLQRHGADARILAGGQSLMPTLNMRLSAPALLIDINPIAGLAGIAVEGNVLRIGAMTRHGAIERSALVHRHAPLLTLAAPHIAHIAIRNRGTLGGSLALADPAAEWPACILALDARLVLQSLDGERRVSARDFFKGLYETALQPGELIVACEIPLATADSRAAFVELARRRGDYAMAGLAAVAQMKDDRLSALRLVYFAVGNRPVAAQEAAKILTSAPFTPDLLRAAQEALSSDLEPMGDLNASAAMKLHLARVLLGRVIGDLMTGNGP